MAHECPGGEEVLVELEGTPEVGHLVSMGGWGCGGGVEVRRRCQGASEVWGWLIRGASEV